ncbi:MAG: dienelactone hydrolase family protein [Bacteroidetes bacterium]|nr:dienelactone hydrolase family protein [Bacteroidota bacterium]
MGFLKVFVLASLVLSIAACGGRNEAQIVEKEIAYSADGTSLKGFIAYDASVSGKRPGILVVHEWWGHNAYARKRARMLAELGYTALAVDMYGDGKQADHPDNAMQFATEVMQNLETARLRFLAALELLKEHETTDPEKIAAIGYCFGGGVVLHAARMGVDIDGVVSFHGGLATEHPAQRGTVIASILVCHGEDDTFVTADQMEAFRREMTDASVDFTIITYPGARHSFTNPDADSYAEKFGMRIAYNKQADEKSWANMQAFLNRIFTD